MLFLNITFIYVKNILYFKSKKSGTNVLYVGKLNLNKIKSKKCTQVNISLKHLVNLQSTAAFKKLQFVT